MSEKRTEIRSLAQKLAAAGVKADGTPIGYKALQPQWEIKTAHGRVSLFDVAAAAGFTRDDVIAAADVETVYNRHTGAPVQIHRFPVETAGKARGKAAGNRTAAAAAVLLGGNIGGRLRK